MPRAIVEIDEHAPPGDVLRLKPSANLVTGEAQFRQSFGQPTTLETDICTMASAVYACDLAFKRGQRERIARDIELTVPVTNIHAFNNVLEQIQYALLILGHDAWRIHFATRSGIPEPSVKWPRNGSGKVLLFSGGLDSFAAAVALGESGGPVHLVSHVTANPTVSGAQLSLFQYIQSRYLLQFDRIAFRVGGRTRPAQDFPFPSDTDREDTQRTRSFLFLALAALAARRLGTPDIVYLAENGQMAIHLPLTAARIGAFSTHTAHPELVHVMGELLSDLLTYPIRIENPFLYTTKAEAIRPVIDRHPEMIGTTLSCWRTLRTPGGARHCGCCVPCLVRRIALEANGFAHERYQRDIFTEDVAGLPPDDDAKRNLIDLAEFVRALENSPSQAALETAFPDLVNPFIDSERAVAMYLRFAAEARLVFGKHPSIRELAV